MLLQKLNVASLLAFIIVYKGLLESILQFLIYILHKLKSTYFLVECLVVQIFCVVVCVPLQCLSILPMDKDHLLVLLNIYCTFLLLLLYLLLLCIPVNKKSLHFRYCPEWGFWYQAISHTGERKHLYKDKKHTSAYM